MSLYKKINAVMAKIDRIPKSGYNSFHKYAYATEADVTEAIRRLLVEQGISFFSSVADQSREGEFTRVKMEFTLVDTDTGEKIVSTFWGEGQDKGDKGLYKAYTGATKYFLMKAFLIPTGDDPEQDAGQQTPQITQGPRSQGAPNNVQRVSSKKLSRVAWAIIKDFESMGKNKHTILEKLREQIGPFDDLDTAGEDMLQLIIDKLRDWERQYKGA